MTPVPTDARNVRFFSLEEANRQLPLVRRIVEDIMAQHRAGDRDELEALDRHGAYRQYARYNLAVALINADQRQRGLDLLDRLGRGGGGGEEVRALRDKANVLLGYLHLQAGDSTKAPRYFQRVRLDGPFANKALLGLGWSYTDSKDFKQALTPWSALRRRDVADNTVQEALLAMPFALDKLNDRRQALRYYRDAIDTYQRLDGRYADLDQRLRNQGLRRVVLGDAPDAALGPRIATLAAHEDQRPLAALFGDQAYQDALHRYREVLAMEAHLARWAQRLMVLDESLAATDVGSLDSDKAKTVSARLERAARRLAEVEHRGSDRDRDGWLSGWFSGDGKGAANPGLDEARHQLTVTQRRWQGLQALTGDSSDPRQRLLTLQSQVEDLRSRVSEVSARYEDRLTQLTLARLNEHKRRVSGYLVQARYAVARIYDQAQGGAEP